ncbi:Galactose-3-O-sulfotransferase 2 [Lonchura striata]|uniref:Galactose-3-O-sulfotransferase 2 n=1 Tax=Lonchura striata TaxID=40157 RepID=A0A218U7J5_9PASE|nr:galactose-3-O-sulfotransferase 2-like [Lonchura striata domestica]OWK49638.1 Galactose-3-O-sulfotransferase 2 [Lonchura striata domestica]
MLKFKRYLIAKLSAIYRCQPGRLWISFSLLVLLLVTLQVVEKLQPPGSCQCELERGLQLTTGHRLASALHSPELLWEDESPQGQREAEPAPASTEDAFRMQLYLRPETPPGSSQEERWMQQPEESSEKVRAHLSPTELKPQLPGLEEAARESPSPSLPGRAAADLAEAVTSKFLIFANRLSTEEERGTSPPGMVQVEVQSQTQPRALSSPHPEWGTSFTQPVPNSAQPLQAEDSYKTDLETGFFPSWTEAFKVKEVTAGEGRQAREVTSQGKTCKPKTDLVFLKVHKSASSTVMNILFRFGETHNLTFAFPRGGGFQLYYPHHFMARFVQGFSPLSPRRFNILCHHMRFLQPEVQKVVPSSAVYFSILRNPVQLMESSFVYYKGASAFSRVRSLEEFLSQPYRYYSPASGDRHYARNLITFDFGFNPDGDVSPERVQLMLKAIEASFDFLLISEYFDESMVLLKEMLCWDLDSVVSFPLNIRDSSTKSPLPDSVVEKLKAWNRLDWEIYTHFNRTFWERIERAVGRERLRREVSALRRRRAELAGTCLQGRGSVAPKDIRDSSLRPLQHGGARILGYNLKQGLGQQLERTCRRLVTPELQYSSLLYKKQFPPARPESPAAPRAPPEPRRAPPTLQHP